MPQQLAGRNSGIVVLGKWLQRQGFHPAEHPAFGGVNPVHVAGSYHYKGEALDLGDATNPPDRLQGLYNLLSKQPEALGIVELFYRDKGFPGPVANHEDHLHVAIAGPPTEDLLKLVGGDYSVLINPGSDPSDFLGEKAKDAASFVGDQALNVAKGVVGLLFKTIGDEGARVLLYLAFVIGGAVLVYYGIARAAGVNKPIGTPASLAVKKGA